VWYDVEPDPRERRSASSIHIADPTERQMVTKYDPDRASDPRLWLAADESELMKLVARWHERARIRMPNPRAHAALHVMVENQAAMLAETPVAEAIKRLMGEGLSRHEALHAIGSVLLTHMNRAASTNIPIGKDAYFADVRGLTKETWYRDYSLEGED
jgi:hypothetical protein